MPTKMLQIPTADGQADAFAAFPDRGERHPGVLLYTDAFGLRPELEEAAKLTTIENDREPPMLACGSRLKPGSRTRTRTRRR